MIIDGYEAYCIINSLKLHFNNKSYSVAKYGYRNVKFDDINTFDRRNDSGFYKRIANKYNTKDSLTTLAYGNLFYNPNLWVGDFLDERAHERYLRAKKVKSSLMYSCLEDTKYILDNNKSLISSFKNGDVLNMIMVEKVQPESFILLNNIMKLNDIQTNIVTSIVKERLEKLRFFVTVPDIQFYEILKQNIKTILSNKTE
jgi:hypothetical protein